MRCVTERCEVWKKELATMNTDAARLRDRYIAAHDQAARAELRFSALMYVTIFIVALNVARDYLRRKQ